MMDICLLVTISFNAQHIHMYTLHVISRVCCEYSEVSSRFRTAQSKDGSKLVATYKAVNRKIFKAKLGVTFDVSRLNT